MSSRLIWVRCVAAFVIGCIGLFPPRSAVDAQGRLGRPVSRGFLFAHYLPRPDLSPPWPKGVLPPERERKDWELELARRVQNLPVRSLTSYRIGSNVRKCAVDVGRMAGEVAVVILLASLVTGGMLLSAGRAGNPNSELNRAS